MWQYFWKDFFLLVIGFLALCMIVVAVVNLSLEAKNKNPKLTVTYDCRLAEISPDYPPMVKQMCRERKWNY